MFKSSSFFLSVLYVVIVNFVVAHTLYLRANRAEAASSITSTSSDRTDSDLVLADSSGVRELRAGSGTDAAGFANSASSPTSGIEIRIFCCLTISDHDVLIGVTSGENAATTEGGAGDDSPSVIRRGSDGKPLAGCTYPRVDGISPDVPINTWSSCDHRKFNVRIGPDYNRFHIFQIYLSAQSVYFI